jgi:hypothetical protein
MTTPRETPRTDAARRRPYLNLLTADVNDKGVLDIDVVKGCTAGIAAHGPKGCYQACYASSIAKFRGIDFSRAVVRTVQSKSQAKEIEAAVKNSPLGFFRIGTMGDPCHAWNETVETVEWLAPLAIPVIITKHWKPARDDHFKRLIACGTILNTSVSALDSAKHLARRVTELNRYKEFGGESVARVVSCDFNTNDPVGAQMAAVQERLWLLKPMIDNPLRVPGTHDLVRTGIIRIRKVKDLAAIRTISVSEHSQTYIGHCNGCSELCGAGLISRPDIRPEARQKNLF